MLLYCIGAILTILETYGGKAYISSVTIYQGQPAIVRPLRLFAVGNEDYRFQRQGAQKTNARHKQTEQNHLYV